MMSRDNLRWLLSIPPGWHDLYRRLVADLEAIDPAVEVVQAKEKFGRMRVYLARFSDELAELKWEAERQSLQICQLCGAPGELMVQSGIYSTVCPHHGQGHSRPDKPPLLTVRVRPPSSREDN
jgi:hypothetical protein